MRRPATLLVSGGPSDGNQSVNRVRAGSRVQVVGAPWQKLPDRVEVGAPAVVCISKLEPRHQALASSLDEGIRLGNLSSTHE